MKNKTVDLFKENVRRQFQLSKDSENLRSKLIEIENELRSLSGGMNVLVPLIEDEENIDLRSELSKEGSPWRALLDEIRSEVDSGLANESKKIVQKSVPEQNPQLKSVASNRNIAVFEQKQNKDQAEKAPERSRQPVKIVIDDNPPSKEDDE